MRASRPPRYPSLCGRGPELSRSHCWTTVLGLFQSGVPLPPCRSTVLGIFPGVSRLPDHARAFLLSATSCLPVKRAADQGRVQRRAGATRRTDPENTMLQPRPAPLLPRRGEDQRTRRAARCFLGGCCAFAVRWWSAYSLPSIGATCAGSLSR